MIHHYNRFGRYGILKKIVEKMEAPLLFAAENTYKRLPLIKNLETVMTFLLQRLKEELHSEAQPRNDEIDRLSSALAGTVRWL